MSGAEVSTVPVPAGVIGVIADSLDGWMSHYYLATKALATAVVEGRLTDLDLTDYPSDHSYPLDRSLWLYRQSQSIALDPSDSDFAESIGIAVDAIIGLAAGAAITADEWTPGTVYSWYFEDAEQLAVHGLTIEAFRAATSALTIRQAAEVITAAFAYLRNR